MSSTSPYSPVPIAINVGVSRRDGLTSFAAGTNLFNAFVGVGILALPSTFNKGGLYSSLILLFSAAVVVNYCVQRILHCETAIKKMYPKTGVLSFTEIGTIAYGRWGTAMSAAALIASQLGFCTAYLSFITHNLNDLESIITRVEWHLILAPLFLLICQVRDLKYFAPLSFSGNFIYLFTFSTIIYSGFKDHCCPGKDEIKFIEPAGLPAVFGTVCFALQGIALVLPLKNKMINGDRFPRVFVIALFLITVVCGIFGTLGFLFFGKNIKDIITLNLNDGPLASAVKLALCFCLISSYATQMFPAAELIDDLLGYPAEKKIMTEEQAEDYQQLPDGESEQHIPHEPSLSKRSYVDDSSDHALISSVADSDDVSTTTTSSSELKSIVRTNIVKICVRLILVLFTLTLSAAVSNFGVVVTIVGGVANSSMSMLLPSLFYLKLCRPSDITRREWYRFAILPLCTIFIGIAAGVCSIEYAIQTSI